MYRSPCRTYPDLRERAALVRANGWDDYQNTWSGGEVLGVRAVLGGPGDLDAACPVWAPTLWGTTEAALDAACGYGVTRRWFAAVAQTEAPNYVDTLEMAEAEKASLAASYAAIGDLAHARGGADREGAEAALESHANRTVSSPPGTSQSSVRRR